MSIFRGFRRVHRSLSIGAVLLAACVMMDAQSAQAREEYQPVVVVLPDVDAVAEYTANVLYDAVETKANKGHKAVLGLATGGTPVPAYALLRKRFRKAADLDLSKVVTFNLDEYVGLPASHPESYRAYMDENLFVSGLMQESGREKGFVATNIHIPNGDCSVWDGLSDSVQLAQLQQRADDYESLLRSVGPVDVQLLGIGENGHVGFAEPGSSFAGRTAVVRLTQSTREANKRFFENNIADVPRRALSMGIASILSAKSVLLVATGTKKAEAVRRMLEGPVDTVVPASALRLHPRVTVVLDTDAASRLSSQPTAAK